MYKRRIIVAPTDLPEFLTGTHHILVYCDYRVLRSCTINDLTCECYERCPAGVSISKWIVATGVDDELLYKLCEAINDELFFAHKN